MKFKHLRAQHIAECTTCHITSPNGYAQSLKPDVPIHPVLSAITRWSGLDVSQDWRRWTRVVTLSAPTVTRRMWEDLTHRAVTI